MKTGLGWLKAGCQNWKKLGEYHLRPVELGDLPKVGDKDERGRTDS
jgi:hypothetical protein